MFKITGTTTTKAAKAQSRRTLALISWTFLAAATLLVFLSGCTIRDTATTTSTSMGMVGAPAKHIQPQYVHLNMDIVINQPGYLKDWPAYSPNNLVVPANSYVTITLHNYDLGDTTMPQGSPFTKVQNTVGGVAYADGHAYSTLAPDRVSHTFTIPQLNINVPVPGDTTTGKPYGTVTFTFHTGAAGMYYFQCFDPCGTGSTGWEGPMITKGYMHGMLIVQG